MPCWNFSDGAGFLLDAVGQDGVNDAASGRGHGLELYTVFPKDAGHILFSGVCSGMGRAVH